jgi:Spy/CpxP family protein refolding chaperone
MKKYLLALSAFTVMAFAANAQEKNTSADAANQQQQMNHDRRGYGMNHRHHAMGMMKDLNLTDAQKKQAKELNSAYMEKVKDLEKDDNITLKDYRAKKAMLEQERKSSFLAMLTSDQKDKLAQAKKEMGEKREMMAKKRMDKMKSDLNLTDAQVEKIQDQRKSSMKAMEEIRENSSLSQEEKKEKFMDLKKSNHENMSNILTADQIKKWDELRHSRMNEWKNKHTNKES